MTNKERKIVNTAVQKIEKLEASYDINYIIEKIKMRDNTYNEVYLCLEAHRADETYAEQEGCKYGEALLIEAYIEDNGIPIDGVGYVKSVEDIVYLVRMYAYSSDGPGRK